MEFLGLSFLVTLLDPKTWLIHMHLPIGTHQPTCHLILVIQKPKNLCGDEGITHCRIHAKLGIVDNETQTIFFVKLIEIFFFHFLKCWNFCKSAVGTAAPRPSPSANIDIGKTCCGPTNQNPPLYLFTNIILTVNMTISRSNNFKAKIVLNFCEIK